MAHDYNPCRVLEVTCPRCGAEPGKDCVTNKGNKSATFHTARKAVVYPEYGLSYKGSDKPGITGNGGVNPKPKRTTPFRQRRLLCTKLINMAIDWYCNVRSDGDLRRAIEQLQDHRTQHPEVSG